MVTVPNPTPDPTPARAVGSRALWDRLLRVCVAVDATLAALVVVWWLGTRGLYNLHYAVRILPTVFEGFEVTSEIVAVIIPIGFGIGFLIGWGRTSRFLLLRGVGAVYVDFFRSMPPIVLILFAFLLGLLGLRYFTTDPFLSHSLALWFGAVALGLHTAAYQAEIVRAGILSVPAGQTDATDAIGLSRLRAMFLVTLPQAFRVSLPALGNEFSSVIKDSSLLGLIGWYELGGTAFNNLYSALTLAGLEGPILFWLEVAVFYFVVTFALNSGVRSLENSFKVPGLEAARL